MVLQPRDEETYLTVQSTNKTLVRSAAAFKGSRSTPRGTLFQLAWHGEWEGSVAIESETA